MADDLKQRRIHDSDCEWRSGHDCDCDKPDPRDARIEALRAENAALGEQALADRRRADEALHDALLWQHSVTNGDPNGQPLLVMAWKQRNEFRGRLAAEVAHADRLAAACEVADGISRDLGWHRIYDMTGPALADHKARRGG